MARLERLGRCLDQVSLAGSVARGQDQSVAAPSDAIIADAIIARKTVMDTISQKMDALETATSSSKKIEVKYPRIICL